MPVFRRLLSLSLCAVVFAGLAPLSSARPAETSRQYRKPVPGQLQAFHVPGELIVEFRSGAKASVTDRAVAAAPGARVVRKVTSRAVVVSVPPGTERAALVRMRSLPGVVHAERNLYRSLSLIPSDPLFGQQWGLHNVGQGHATSNSPTASASGTPDADIDAPEAWDVTTGAEQTVIAVVDAGVDVDHPAIAANIWRNAGEIAGNGIDDDGNGYVDDVNGWDFAEDDNTLLEPDPSIVGAEHGTHVAGTIAAGIDGTGVVGVCPDCRLMVLKIGEPVDTDGDWRDDTMLLDLASELAALRYARSMGADVVNASFGIPVVWSKLEWRELRRVGAAGIPTVASAGNFNGDNDMFLAYDFHGDAQPESISPFYPASYDLPGIISVAASNHHDQYGYVTDCAGTLGDPLHPPCTFTNWGHVSVDLAAPGVDIVSSIPGGDYAFFDGTSMAAPHVSGAIGLWISRHGSGHPVAAIKQQLLQAVDTPSTLRTLRAFPGSGTTGSFTATDGRLNAHAALLGAQSARIAQAGDGEISGATGIRRARSGRVRWPEDVNDVYRKRLVRGRRYRVVLDGPAGEDFDLWTWKPGTKQIWQIEEGCIGGPGGCKMLKFSAGKDADERVRIRIRRTGTYYFQVAAWLFSGGSYSLRVKRI